MALIIRNNYGLRREFGSLRRAMDRFFDDSFFTARGSRDTSYATLPGDISERDGDLVVRASLPGFGRDEIDVRVNDGVLSISAAHDDDGDKTGQEEVTPPTDVRVDFHIRRNLHKGWRMIPTEAEAAEKLSLGLGASQVITGQDKKN